MKLRAFEAKNAGGVRKLRSGPHEPLFFPARSNDFFRLTLDVLGCKQGARASHRLVHYPNAFKIPLIIFMGAGRIRELRGFVRVI